MKKRNKQKRDNKRFRWPVLVGLATVVIAVGAITVISRQSGSIAKSNSPSPSAQANQANKDKKYVTVKVAGRDVQVDPQTGQVRPMSREEAEQMAEGLKKMLNKSADGLVQEQHPDGSVSMDLQGRFQNVAVARVEADGTVTQSCIDKPQQAASFFGIEPTLMGVEAKEVQSPQQPARVSPAKKSRQ